MIARAVATVCILIAFLAFPKDGYMSEVFFDESVTLEELTIEANYIFKANAAEPFTVVRSRETGKGLEPFKWVVYRFKILETLKGAKKVPSVIEVSTYDEFSYENTKAALTGGSTGSPVLRAYKAPVPIEEAQKQPLILFLKKISREYGKTPADSSALFQFATETAWDTARISTTLEKLFKKEKVTYRDGTAYDASIVLHFHQAVKLIKEKNGKDAKQLLESLNTGGKGELEADRLFHLARAEALLGKIDTAIAVEKQLLKTRPKHTAAHYNLACYYLRKKDKKNALSSLQQMVQTVQAGKEQKKFLELLNTDPDLELLRSSKEFQEIIKSLKTSR